MNIFLITRLLLSYLPVTVMSPLLLQNVVFTPVDIACSNVIPPSLYSMLTVATNTLNTSSMKKT